MNNSTNPGVSYQCGILPFAALLRLAYTPGAVD
jgi:hypothetical protein